MRYVIFSLAGQPYALSIDCITEVALPQKFTHLPGSEPYVKGVMNLRGRVIPLIDLAEKLSLPSGGKKNKIIVAEISGKVQGFLVDDVASILELESIEPLEQETFVEGIARAAGEIIVVLKPEKLL